MYSTVQAACANENLTIRDYIPPNFYARFSAVAKKTAEKRAIDRDLKTQIRWGDADLEIFVKRRGGEDRQFKKMSLKEFMGATELPEFDVSIKWEKKGEKSRRKLDFKHREDERPSMGKMKGQEDQRNNLIRQRSIQEDTEQAKKRRGTFGQEMDTDEQLIPVGRMDKETSDYDEEL